MIKCLCCNEMIKLTKKNKINNRNTIYDGDYFHKECYNFEKYGKPYKRPNRLMYVFKLLDIDVPNETFEKLIN